MRGRILIGWIAALLIGAIATLPAGSAQAWGTLVVADYSCSYGKVTATLVWSGNSPYATGQYVQMSYTDNGWQPHTTTTAEPYQPSVNTMAWDGLQPSTRHFLRFTQQFPDGSWDASLTFRFDTPSCGADGFTPTFLSHVPDGLTLAGSAGGAPSNGGAFSLPGDYDCAGGPGDGPNFIEGPVDVSGGDPYGLDADGDGIGCEPGDF